MYSAPQGHRPFPPSGGTQSDSRDRENAVNNFQDIESFLDSVLVQTPVSLNADLVPTVLSKGLGLNTDSTSFGQQGSNDRKQGSGKPWSSVSNGVPLTQRNTTTNNFNNGSTEAAKQNGARKEDTDGSGRRLDGKKPETAPVGTGNLQPSPHHGNTKGIYRVDQNVGGMDKGKEVHPGGEKIVGEGSMGMKGESFRPDMNALQSQQQMVQQMYAANMVKPDESGALMGRLEQQAGKGDPMASQARMRGGVPEQQQQQQMYPPGMMFPPQQQAGSWGYAPMPYYYPTQSQFQAACMNQPFPYPMPVPPSAMGQQRRFAFYPGLYQEAPIGGEEEDIDDKAKALKKSRLVWTKELHMSFLAAIDRCGGIQKASPKAIMKDMNVDGLTRENVASHLQKYRMRLKKSSSQEQHDIETDDNGKKDDHSL